MKKWLIILFVFFIGSFSGWLLEVVFRRFFSKANPERRWINPGFLQGPYLPLYGFSLTMMYLLANMNVSFIHNKILQKLCLFTLMALIITFFEYIAGKIFIVNMKIKLWDYSDEPFNIEGIICLKFTCFWYILCAIYYFLLHNHIKMAIVWLANHLQLSFFIGFFLGIMFMDFCYSMNVASKIKTFAKENEIVVHIDTLRYEFALLRNELNDHKRFLLSLKMDTISLKQALYVSLDHFKNMYK